jgi:hypothetical protein
MTAVEEVKRGQVMWLQCPGDISTKPAITNTASRWFIATYVKLYGNI